MGRFLQKIGVIAVFCIVLSGFAALAYVLYQRNNPEAKLIDLLLDDNKRVAQAFFSPDDDIRSILLDLVHVEKKRMLIAIYTLTDKKIAYELINARKRGVVIECVVDSGYGHDRYSKIALLAQNNIPIWVYQSDEGRNASLMHDKFCVFESNIEGRSMVWTGSFNFTVRAHERNQENVVVLDNKRIVEKFIKQFKLLKERSLLINGKATEETGEMAPDYA